MSFPAFRSIVRRHLSPTGRYFEVGSGRQPPQVRSLVPDEKIFGWYRNPPPSEDSYLVFTNTGIHSVETNAAGRIGLNEVVSAATPVSKQEALGVQIMTLRGERFLRAGGSFGPINQHKDAFSLLNILRVLATRNNREG